MIMKFIHRGHNSVIGRSQKSAHWKLGALEEMQRHVSSASQVYGGKVVLVGESSVGRIQGTRLRIKQSRFRPVKTHPRLLGLKYSQSCSRLERLQRCLSMNLPEFSSSYVTTAWQPSNGSNGRSTFEEECELPLMLRVYLFRTTYIYMI